MHHIIPKEDNGPNDITNAAPLCGSCHDTLGANAALQKQMRERRDAWWEYCARIERQTVELAAERLLARFDHRASQIDERDEQGFAEFKKELVTTFKVQAPERLLDAMSSATTMPELKQAASSITVTNETVMLRVRSDEDVGL